VKLAEEGADIIALAVALRRVMAFPELGQHLFQTDFSRIKSHLDHFGVIALRAFAPLQQSLVGQHGIVGTCHVAIGVTAFDIEHAGNGRHALFRAPETAHAEHNRIDLTAGRLNLGGRRLDFVIGTAADQKTGRESQDHSLKKTTRKHDLPFDGFGHEKRALPAAGGRCKKREVPSISRYPRRILTRRQKNLPARAKIRDKRPLAFVDL
jgi:hypothetical protein